VDVSAALATLAQAISIARGMRDIERSFDEATYKAQAAELYGALADVKMALTDAKEELHSKDQTIRELEAAIETLKSGENCPLCQTGRMKVTASRPHEHFAFAGVHQHTLTCQNPDCRHSEQRMYDPNNVTGTKR
jgi:hypothetical protein